MARPKTISREEILDAARVVFQERGFSGTTSEIAKQAGISEGSIFRRFKSKHELFLESMGLREPTWMDLLELEPLDDFWGHLEHVSQEILAFMMDSIPKMVLMTSVHARTGIPEDSPPIQGQRKLIAFFDYHREESPAFERTEEIARIYFGALHSFAFASYIGFSRTFKTDPDRYIETLLLTLGAPEDYR